MSKAKEILESSIVALDEIESKFSDEFAQSIDEEVKDDEVLGNIFPEKLEQASTLIMNVSKLIDEAVKLIPEKNL